MTPEPNPRPVMEIPIAEYESLIASCDAWRTWADEMHRGLVQTGGTEPTTRWVIDSWFEPESIPQTDKEGILLEQPGKGEGGVE